MRNSPVFYSSVIDVMNGRRRRDVNIVNSTRSPDDQDCGPGSGLGIVSWELVSAAQVWTREKC